MNARQKAKRFKKLYEDFMNMPFRNMRYVNHSDLNHFKTQVSISKDDVEFCEKYDNIELLKTVVENETIAQLRPLIWDRLNVNKESPYKTTYSFDIWLEEKDDKA